MKTDAGRIRIARAVARGEAASSALDEAAAREGEQFREDVAKPPGSQGENVDDVRAQVPSNPFDVNGSMQAQPSSSVPAADPEFDRLVADGGFDDAEGAPMEDAVMDIVDVVRNPPVASGCDAHVIARRDLPVSEVDRRRDVGVERTDREGQHRKLIMESRPIGELVAPGGGGPRTSFPLRPKAALASPPLVEQRRVSEKVSTQKRLTEVK